MEKAEKLILKAFLEIKPPNFSEKVLDGRPFFILHDYYAGYVLQLLDGKTIICQENKLFSKKTEEAINSEMKSFSEIDKLNISIYLRLLRLTFDIITKLS